MNTKRRHGMQLQTFRKRDALKNFHLAPPNCRRDMAMLGVIHRAVMGRGHEQVRIFFVPDTSGHMHGRNIKRRHSMQI